MSCSLPWRRGSQPAGFTQTCTVANTNYVVTVPAEASGVIIWFDNGTTMVRGRVAIDDVNTTVAVSNNSFGYAPPWQMEFDIKPKQTKSGGAWTQKPLYLHVACATAGAVATGTWLYKSDRR